MEQLRPNVTQEIIKDGMITSLKAFWRETFAWSVVIPTQTKTRKIQGRFTKLAFASALLFPTTAQAENPSTKVGDFKKGIQPILEQHCYDCHGRKKTKGKVDLTTYASWADLEKNPQLIEKMIEALGKNEMPPEEEKQPSDKQRKLMVLELDKAFRNAVAHDTPVIPLRLRRMNRFEYSNAVKDLFELKSWVYSINDRIIRNHNDYFRPESGQMPKVVRVGNRIMGLQQLLEDRLLGVVAFPKDPPAENGFNNRGDHLSLTPVLMESFLELSRSIVHAENFEENCRVWDELFEDPSSTKLKQPIENIAHQRIEKFLLKAFKSPADEKTLKLYTGYFDKQYQKSSDFTRSMKDIVSAALASPRFIFVHNETDQASPNQASFNLATRLSLFLWSSIPDDELLELAGKGRLHEIAVLNEQVDRMLNHRRVKNFCDSFAPQWLKLNNVVSASPNFKAHREYYFGGDDKISYKRGMHMMLEPLLNFETVFIENRPISDLVDSDFTYRSHLLSEWYQGRAATYGINVNLRDIEFTRTPLNDRKYGGVITTGAVMVMTSSPFRSLPITRGAWVSSVIFNDPPEPPPDDIPNLKADDETLQREGLTVRQKLKQHSSDTQCAGCHKKIDPLGFVLENYDLLGRWRDDYRTGLKVDASGTLFGKHEFEDVVGFKDAVLAEEDVFAKAFVGHLLSYALGRELTFADRVAIGEIAEASKKGHYRMRAVIKNIAVHPIFTQIKKQ
ncbi:MAG: mono/diheme cytochrome c family protein [Akkermansiaceae bacterium]|jgi:mono/diheme cytochrome c family protein